MKKLILNISISLFFSISVSAQIGIMTDNPAGNTLLHIDTQENNHQAGINTNQDDIVIDKIGNVGIGTINPQLKLHIVTGGTASNPIPQFRIEDGYQGTNKVLTSDADGFAKWSDYIPGYNQGIVGTGITYATTSTTWNKTNMTISLASGQWIIFYTISMTINNLAGQPDNYRCWIQTSVGDDNSIRTTDAISPNKFSNNGFIGKRSSVNGWVAIDNKLATPKTYSIYIGEIQNSLPGLNLLNVGEKEDGYSSIYAFRINMQ